MAHSRCTKYHKALLLILIIMNSNYVYTQAILGGEEPFYSKEHHFKISFPCLPDLVQEESSTIYSCALLGGMFTYRVHITGLSGDVIIDKAYTDNFINSYKKLAIKNNQKYEVVQYKTLKAIVLDTSYDLGNDLVMANRTITFLMYGASYTISLSTLPELVEEDFFEFINSLEIVR